MSENWQIGDIIEQRYEVHDIRKGGMGVVFLCYDHAAGEPIAIKTYQDKYLLNNDFVERFVKEADAWIHLDRHPNIVKADRVENIHFRPYLFLEYIAGDEYYGIDLSGWIEKKGLNFKRILDFGIQICAGMSFAQKVFQTQNKLFIHRDLKPANILITRDRVVKITDFGLAKVFDSADLNMNCGTAEYMSPEQFLGLENIDIRSDIYSFGCVLFEMVCGVKPFVINSPDTSDVIRMMYKKKHLEEAPPEPVRYRKDCPVILNDLILKCLAKNPDQRFSNFEVLKEILLQIYAQLNGEAYQSQPNIDFKNRPVLSKYDLTQRGSSLDSLGKWQEAVECYNRALVIKEDPDLDYVLYCNRGVTMEKMNRSGEAVEDFNQAVAIDSRTATAYCLRANVLNNLGRWPEAIDDYQKALALDEQYAVAYYNQGLCYVRLGRFREALTDFEKAIENGFQEAHTNQGAVFCKLGQLDQALNEFNKAIELNPRDVIAYTNQGNVFEEIGEQETALNNYDRALTINPSYIFALFNRGNLYQKLGRFEEAISDYSKILEINPAEIPKVPGTTVYALSEMEVAEIRSKTFYNYGITQFKIGRFKEAKECFISFLKLVPSQYQEQIRLVEKALARIESQR